MVPGARADSFTGRTTVDVFVPWIRCVPESNSFKAFRVLSPMGNPVCSAQHNGRTVVCVLHRKDRSRAKELYSRALDRSLPIVPVQRWRIREGTTYLPSIPRTPRKPKRLQCVVWFIALHALFYMLMLTAYHLTEYTREPMPTVLEYTVLCAKVWGFVAGLVLAAAIVLSVATHVATITERTNKHIKQGRPV
ncbi:MAG: hypothetical protein H6815_05145 [Phycisphaeraceae bacterium]|nr:hypothetical protein [Phycisphaerales bacterium]MCB9859822.1 hypothetical protein [Phycisphaeraceae bacterium]